VVSTQPLKHDFDSGALAYGRRLTYEQRLAEAASWNLIATQFQIAGAKARRRTSP
jgi:hypothetical protein